MHYYTKNIADFNNATRHLTRLERSIYSDLLELQYDIETPLPNDIDWICRRILANTEEERTIVERMLNEWFDLVEQGWSNGRVEGEIEAFHDKKQKAIEAGKASGRARRRNKKPNKIKDDEQTLNGRSADVELTNNHKPITTNHKPIDIGDKSPSKKRFIKPSVGDIYAYCLERKNKINPQQFYDYYESIGWKVGKNPMKDWKATIRTWERKHEENGQRDTRSRGEKHNDILDRIARESLERESIGGTLGGGDIQEIPGEVYPQVDFGD